MLRGLVFVSLISFFVSCGNKEQAVLLEKDDFITTREAGYEQVQSPLEIKVQGNWIELCTDSIAWSFHKNELKWKGFSHIVTYKEGGMEVGSIVFNVSETGLDTLVLLNISTNERHTLTKQPVLRNELV
jgi:hypothetical protein